MAVDPVPYVVHGAKHSADVFRQGIHDSTGGAEGVSLPNNLRVKQTGTPSSQVQVAPGGVLILNSYSGGVGQSYSGRNASATLVDVPASDSTGAKSWYIIFRVQDPQFGGPAPSSVESGPYSFIECVSTSATISDPHYRLAKIVVPKSTAVIDGSMIEDLREVANPIVGSATFSRPRLMEDNDPRHNYVNARYDGTGGRYSGEMFPGGDGSPNSTYIKVPLRATSMSIRADWVGVKCEDSKNSHGLYWMEFGDEYKNHGWPLGRQFEYATQQFAFDTTGTQGNYRTSWPLIDQVSVPKKLRGKSIRFGFKAGLSDSADTNGVYMDQRSGLGLDIKFSMQAVDEDTI